MFLICGAGQFGSRASYLLSQDPINRITIIDYDLKKLDHLSDLPVIKIHADVLDYLSRQQPLLKPASIVIPAVPFHLAFKWLLAMMPKKFKIYQSDIPLEIFSKLPHPGQGSEKDILCSYADFLCPADCTEPEDFCTVTGEARKEPLFELIAGIKPEGFQTGVIRSRQIGPGIGGYPFEEILILKRKIMQGKTGKWLVGTACRCHGVLSAFEIAR